RSTVAVFRSCASERRRPATHRRGTLVAKLACMSGHRPSWIAFAVMLLAIALAIAGFAANWYENVGWADKLAHFVVALGIAMYMGALLEHRRATVTLGAGWRVILVVSATLMLGILWEVLEWLFRVQATTST